MLFDMAWLWSLTLPLLHTNKTKQNQNCITMRNTLNIQFSLETYELIINTLKNSEIAKLARAIVAHQRQDAPERFLTSTELRRAFALLFRDNGETPTFPVPSVTSVRSVPSVKTQKTKKNQKKEELPPTPPYRRKKNK